MMRFMWNALQRGDLLLVHVDHEGGYPLREAVVAMVDARATAHEVGVRFLVDGMPGSTISWPRRLLVHSSPLSDADQCWRCAETAEATSVPPATTASSRAPGKRRSSEQP